MEIYQHDGIAFHSKRQDVLPHYSVKDDLVAATLRPEFPLVVVVHDEADSQVRNTFEQLLIELLDLDGPAGPAGALVAGVQGEDRRPLRVADEQDAHGSR